jgi:hypothetical protein
VPFRAFPSWFLRIECDRCGKVSMLNEAHTTGRRRAMPLRALLARMRHDGCGGLPGKAELLTGIVCSAGVRPAIRTTSHHRLVAQGEPAPLAEWPLAATVRRRRVQSSGAADRADRRLMARSDKPPAVAPATWQRPTARDHPR